MKVLFISLFVVIIDQVTKFFVKGIKIPFAGINILGMPYGSSKSVFGNFVRITFVENSAMAMGFELVPRTLLIFITFLALFLMLIYIFKHRNGNKFLLVSLALILGGAIGNFIDRTFYGLIYNYSSLFSGNVVDFIHIGFWNFTFLGRTHTSLPILNIADVSITSGFLLILIFYKKIFYRIDNNSVMPSYNYKVE